MKPCTLIALVFVAAACSRKPPEPAVLDTRNTMCALCRMLVTDARFAAQLVAPGEEPKFFDDIGCLRSYLVQVPELPRGSVAYVADHRTTAWALAAGAIYTQNPAIETPMSSHLIAHSDEASRALDPAAAGVRALSAAEVFRLRPAPQGGPR